MTFETITIRTVAKRSNLSRKAIVKAIEELGFDVYGMRMKAYGARGHVNQIKLSDVEKVIAKAVEYKEEPKQPRVPKLEQLKANGFEVLSETKTMYKVSKDGVTRSVGKHWSIEKILKKFEGKKEEKDEFEVEPTPVYEEKVNGFSKDEIAVMKEEIEPQIVEEEVKEKFKREDLKPETIAEIKKAIEKEFPDTEVKELVVVDRGDDENHYWVRWDGVEHNANLGDIKVGFPLMEVTIKPEEIKKEEEMKVEEVKEVKPEAVPMSWGSIYGGDVDPVTGIEGVEVEDEFGEKLEDSGSFDINKLYAMYSEKDARMAKEKGRACEIKD